MPRLSLRARLLLGVLVLAAAGLFAADAVTYTSLRSSLLSRVDSTLESEHHGAENAQFGHGGPQPNDYVQVRASDGKILYSSGVPHFPGTAEPSPPKLPANITGSRGAGRTSSATSRSPPRAAAAATACARRWTTARRRC